MYNDLGIFIHEGDMGPWHNIMNENIRSLISKH